MYRSKEERLVYKKLNSADADSETPRRLPHATYVLHRTGCSQAEDQLLREAHPSSLVREKRSIGSLSAGWLCIDGPLLIQGLFSAGAPESLITLVLPRGSYGRETIV